MSIRTASSVLSGRSSFRQLVRQLCSVPRKQHVPDRIGEVWSLPSIPELGPESGEMGVFIRESDLELREAVLGKEGKTAPLILLDGERGTGKSTAMRAAVAAARASGHVAMYIPRASTWTHGGGFFCPAEGEAGPQWYERPGPTCSALEALLELHSDDLARVPCPSEDASDLREAAERGVQLIVRADDDWRQNPVNAGHLFSAVVEGLAAEEDLRFIVAIDEVDAFAGLSALSNNRGRAVHSCAISAVGRHFGRDAIEPFSKRMVNGAVLLAQSGYHPLQNLRKSRVLGSTAFPVSDEIRGDPSGKQWLSDMWETDSIGKLVVRLERFERGEMEEMLKLQNIDIGEVDSGALERLLVLAAGRGDVLSKMSAGL